MCLYEKIDALCKEKEISIYQMCKDNRINQNMVSNWKARGTEEPSLSVAVKLSKYFKKPVNYFVKGI